MCELILSGAVSTCFFAALAARTTSTACDSETIAVSTFTAVAWPRSSDVLITSSYASFAWGIA